MFFGACLVIMGITAAVRGLYHVIAADPGVLALPLVLAAVIAAVIIANKRYGKTSPAPPPPPPPPSWPGAGYTPPPAAPPAAATGRPWCPHAGAEPVDLVTGERVAWVCPDCGTQLEPGFRSPVRGRAQ